ncbi:MAG: biotin--[acetyl-CoA-carboxylase] ligase [Deltaproteobacteria bacterium]|nr:biotin--[acetyl-CoA-carboxylase] ligase [Deltaproteobacteria bacterium]
MPPLEHDHIGALTPDPRALRIREVENGLGAKRLGTRFHYFSKLGSTNNHARWLAEQGEPEGAVVIAEQQTRGRGRLGRRWFSPAYVNLYCSIILRPTLDPRQAPQITLAAAVALADAIESVSPVAAKIKWPNDILAGGKKLAGVLTEAVSKSNKIEFVILGIGVNVNFPLESMPPDIRERAASLSHLAGASIRRETLLRRLIQDLDRCYGILEESGFAAIAPRWQARFELRDRRVRVAMTDGTVTGRAVGIDGEGALMIETPDGERQRILAGDVIPAEESET